MVQGSPFLSKRSKSVNTASYLIYFATFLRIANKMYNAIMIRTEIRPGAYYDSVILMHLQRALVTLENVEDAGVMMGTEANKEILAQSSLLTADGKAAGPDDLIIAVRAPDDQIAEGALAQVDTLINERRSGNGDADAVNGYRPKTLNAAIQSLPAARWVLVSVPGKYAADVSRDALRAGKNVFLYSDNVSLEDELALKESAAAQGLLVMGPDCGTAIVNGVGLGFANRVRRGNIGVIGASGTGLQHVTARIHQLGGGITHALGTGGRDLSQTIHAITATQALDLLRRDDATDVIVLISKPPAQEVAEELLRAIRATGKPAVVNFIGYTPTTTHQDNIRFAQTLDAAAAVAVKLAAQPQTNEADDQTHDTDASKMISTKGNSAKGNSAKGNSDKDKNTARYLRGIFSGGTLAYEAMLLLENHISAVYSNAPLRKELGLEKATESYRHTIVDLGEDEFTVGRLHPMMDNELRIKRIAQEAADPETAIILLDIVLGYGAHPDPVGELLPAIDKAFALAASEQRPLEIVAIVVGTDEDPQDMASQIEQLAAAGVHVETDHERAAHLVGEMLGALSSSTPYPPVDLREINQPLAAINIGIETFTQSLTAQEAPVIHVDWRPSAGGNEKLAGILARMKSG